MCSASRETLLVRLNWWIFYLAAKCKFALFSSTRFFQKIGEIISWSHSQQNAGVKFSLPLLIMTWRHRYFCFCFFSIQPPLWCRGTVFIALSQSSVTTHVLNVTSKMPVHAHIHILGHRWIYRIPREKRWPSVACSRTHQGHRDQ